MQIIHNVSTTKISYTIQITDLHVHLPKKEDFNVLKNTTPTQYVHKHKENPIWFKKNDNLRI